MKDHHGNTIVSRIKTGSIERRLHLAATGLVAGSRMATQLATSFLGSKSQRQAKRQAALARQAAYLAEEMGKLKGSVVKIGQMMALYGEHFLPEEVTEALHAFEHQTTALKWNAIRQTLRKELGDERLSDLKVERVPIGAASLGQVHRATRLSDGQKICLKIQYPGVANAVDSDLNGVANLLFITRIIKATEAFHDWLEEIRTMLHREIDYQAEAETTQSFAQRLANDSRFIVPEVFPEYSTDHVLATSWESGVSITDDTVQKLSQERRNKIAESLLELFFEEMFCWSEIQTDPNFGNYRIRIDQEGDDDKIILLDFGAVRTYPPEIINPINHAISAAWHRDGPEIIKNSMTLGFISNDMPSEVHEAFVSLSQMMIEPVTKADSPQPDNVRDHLGRYLWRHSDLPGRIVNKATRSAVSRYFEVPPKEFIFLNRKLMGVYTLMSVLDARLDSSDLIARYLPASQTAELATET